ncbi:hypothetical protein JT358_05575 [Micrococcales bacterium 31B]|nr:hypothetical protein [Micrococcales bacterium 31B]
MAVVVGGADGFVEGDGRDHLFAIAWLALMAGAWFGWAQEDPKPRHRPLWGALSVTGLLVALAFGLLVGRNWAAPTSLEGQYWVLGLIVALEGVLIGGGFFFLKHRGLLRWMGWWAALSVALHFFPLAWIFQDWSYVVLTTVQVIGLLAMLPVLRGQTFQTSRWAAPWLACTFLVYALISGALALSKYGYPL